MTSHINHSQYNIEMHVILNISFVVVNGPMRLPQNFEDRIT